MKKGILFILTALTVISPIFSEHLPFYRKDYTFLEEFDAFYKLDYLLGQTGLSWNMAFKACDDEGSQLFYPKEKDEWTVAKNLAAVLPTSTNITDVLIGIHDVIGFGEFVTVDGQTTPSPLKVSDVGDCVIMDLQTGVMRIEPCVTKTDPPKRLFVCKKVDEKPCPTIDLDYKFNKETKKCYKISTREKTWSQAFHTCHMEGGILVAPENSVEAKIIQDMIEDSEYFAGFRRLDASSDFFTVKGKQLEIAYNVWYDRAASRKEDCGVIYKYNALYLKTKSCSEMLRFICEMKAKIF